MFHKGSIICGIKNWRLLTGEVIKSRIITIRNIDCCFPSTDFVGPFIFNSSILRIQNCDKEFVKYNLKPHLFPNIKYLYLDSEPDEEIFKAWNFCSNKDFIGKVGKEYEYILDEYRKKYPKNKFIINI
jgi:hypothetical protein